MCGSLTLVRPVTFEGGLFWSHAAARSFELTIIGLGFAIFCLTLSGCASIGPGSVQRDRVDYDNALATSWKDQLLTNIVRLRYADAPQFMDVSSVVGSYQIAGQLQAGATANFGHGSSPYFPHGTSALSGNGQYVDRPTVSYTPLTGKKFTQSLLEPIQPSAIFSLIAAGYPVELVIPLTVRALNGVYDRTYKVGVRRPADPEFAPLMMAMQRIQNVRAFSLRIEKRGNDQIAIGVWDVRRRPEARRDIEFVARTLRLSPKNGEVTLTYGAVQRKKDELAVLSSSMLEILNDISGDIEVPMNDVSDGRTYANVEESVDEHPDASRIRIRSGASAPSNAFAAVRYGDSWYWISDGDLRSKRAFTFLSLFFSLAETGAVPAAPVLTLPVQ
jgi:hypothetical protein